MKLWSWLKKRYKRKRPIPNAPIEPHREGGKVVSIDVHGTVNFTEKEKDFFVATIKLKAYILSSQEFKQRFINMECTETAGKTMTEIYYELMSGSDKFNLQEDHDIDIFITMYGHSSRSSRVLGYTFPSTYKTWVSRYHFHRWMKMRNSDGREVGRAHLASNLLHEYFHNLGYNHRNWRKSTSVPYRAGYLMRDLGISVFNGRHLTPLVIQ